MRNSVKLVLAGTLLALAAQNVSAATKKPKHVKHARHQTVAATSSYERPPLTVNRRSFLDPGPVVPVGSLNNYVNANTIFNQTPDQTFLRSRFNNESLPRPLEVPGRDAYILQFSTPPELGQPAELAEPFGFPDDED